MYRISSPSEDRTDSLWAVAEEAPLIRERRREARKAVHQPFEFEQLEQRILLSGTAAAVMAGAVSDQTEQRIEQQVQAEESAKDQAGNHARDAQPGTPESGATVDF